MGPTVTRELGSVIRTRLYGDRIPVVATFSAPAHYRPPGPTQPHMEWVTSLSRGHRGRGVAFPSTPSSAGVKERVQIYSYSPVCLHRRLYRVSIKSFPDYKHLLQENYVEYKTYLFTITSKMLCHVFIVMLQSHMFVFHVVFL
jgi:hypothetical protein